MEMLSKPAPRGLSWRSSTSYILSVVGIAMFADLFLYGLIVPILPYILSGRLHTPHHEIQQSVSLLLAFYAGASVLSSLPAGYIADSLPSRRLPFLVSLSAMFLATMLLWIGQSWTVLMIARIFQGTAAAVVWTVGLALTLETVGSRRLGVVLNSLFSFICVGELLAPVLGGWIYENLGEFWVFNMGFAMLFIDLVMRILVVEKKTVKRYGWDQDLLQFNRKSSEERSPLLSSNSSENHDTLHEVLEPTLSEWKLPQNMPGWTHKMPIVYLVFSSPRFLTALLLSFTHAVILATFDATIPIQSLEYFSFSARSAGFLFVPLILPYLLLAPVAGYIVDRNGSKPLAVFGLIMLAISLSLFGFIHAVLPDHPGYNIEVVKFSLILLACGGCLSAIGSQSLVDGSKVLGYYEKANPEFFPHGSPFAQLYAMNNMVFSLGLTIGPLCAGRLRVSFGYAIMNYCISGWCILVALLCVLFLGGVPPIISRIGICQGKKCSPPANCIVITVVDENGNCSS